uniref:T9SS type A sorting domain-containing protein n=1 Tax=Dyadobacter sp. TaxID=1914288 RepID=UPI003F6E93B3
VTVPRVGVGEVFMITGNSNAMGLPGLGAKDASSNVISFNKTNKTLNSENITVAPNAPMPAPAFEVLKKDNYIFPNGETAWYWGQLGDMLSGRWNCPVLFFNTAWAAANSENYRDAATGKDAYNLYVGKFWPNRQPYSNIVNTLKYLTAEMGMRAVLWSHGENDAQLGFTETNYFNHIRTLITNSRTDAGYNAPWVLARNSVSNLLPNPYLPVLNAQNRLTEIPNFNVFKGPYLDTIQIPRPVSGHFESLPGGVPGLTHAAQAWNRTLSDEFVKKLHPVLPTNQIYTGVTPGIALPGAYFNLTYRLGNSQDQPVIQAELLDQSGNFVDTVGTGMNGNVEIRLPYDLNTGTYRIRLTARSRTIPGSISDSFYVDKSYVLLDRVNKIATRAEGDQIRISWLIAAHPYVEQLVLQKTTDGIRFSDIETFTATPRQSQVLSYLDADVTSAAAFYRIKSKYRSGSESVSRIAAFFRNGLEDLTVFPNPVTNGYFYVRTSPGKLLSCQLFSVSGKAHSVSFSDKEIEGLTVIRPAAYISAGVYILKMVYESGTRSSRVIIK